MITWLTSIALLAPMLAAGVGLLVRKHARARDLVTLTGLGTAAGAALGLLFEVEANGGTIVRVGDWAPELGIALGVDLFAALVLPIALVVILVVELFALGQRRSVWGADPEIVGPLLCVLTSGVALAILTGDLFTLFVSFELILVSSYVLLTHRGERAQIRSGMTYVAMNLLSSTLFLLGIAFVYSATGTVNMALLAERMGDLSDGTKLGIGAWFLVVFGTKAAVFPLFSWLPDSYPTAPTTITAVFAGLLTKIGVYSLIRFHTITGMDDLGPLMLAAAAITMIVGALGALAQSDMKRILSFHVISQIGYMLLGLGLFSVAGTAGAIVFLVHHMPVKTVLFLVGGLVEHSEGTSSLDKVGALARRRPLVGLLFALPALSLAGLPPFSGFVAKFAVISAAITDTSPVITVAALVGGALTLLSMTKIWVGVFWGTDPDDTRDPASPPPGRRIMEGATALAVGVTLTISLLAGTLFDLSVEAAEDLHAQVAEDAP